MVSKSKIFSLCEKFSLEIDAAAIDGEVDNKKTAFKGLVAIVTLI